MAKVEVVKSEKADKPNYIWVVFIAIFLVITIGGVIIGSSSEDESSLNDAETTKQTENKEIENKFLNSPIIACPNKTLKDGIDSINEYSSNFSAKYELKDVEDQDYLVLDITVPNDRIVAVIGIKEEGVFVADAEADSIKESMTEQQDISLYSAIAASKLLCD